MRWKSTRFDSLKWGDSNTSEPTPVQLRLQCLSCLRYVHVVLKAMCATTATVAKLVGCYFCLLCTVWPLGQNHMYLRNFFPYCKLPTSSLFMKSGNVRAKRLQLNTLTLQLRVRQIGPSPLFSFCFAILLISLRKVLIYFKDECT